MHRQTHRPRRGFTLIELLVVIVVIGVLLTLVVAVGSRVVGGNKASLTQDLIRTLDVSLESYMGDNNGEIPPAVVAVRELDPSDPEVDTLIPVIDGIADTSEGEVVINSVGLFLRAIEGSGAGDEIARGFDAKHMRKYSPIADGETSPDTPVHPELATVFDAWGQPLRFVHPKFHGEVVRDEMRAAGSAGPFADAEMGGYFFSSGITDNFAPDFIQIRRNFITTADREINPNLVGDGDGGLTVGGRPYFYSMGPDADPSKREDNVYSTEPKFLPDRE